MFEISYEYTDKERKEIKDSIVILRAGNEQKNQHIINYLNGKKIKHKEHALNFGDYSFMIPCMPHLGFVRDTYFDKQIVVERKNSLEEISSNFAENRTRFENEWIRAKDCKKYLIIEQGSYRDIIHGNYKTQFKSQSFLASMLSFEQRYNIYTVFSNKEDIGLLIYSYFYYYLHCLLKK